MMKKGDTFNHEFLLSSDIYKGFVSLFNDYNPLHTDKQFANGKGFADVVMHGNILGGFLSYFIGECLPLKNVIIHSQEIKYMKPIFRDQLLVLKAEVNDVFESVNVVEFKFTFMNKIDSVQVAKGKIQIGII